MTYAIEALDDRRNWTRLGGTYATRQAAEDARARFALAAARRRPRRYRIVTLPPPQPR